jgi:molybdenum cofactor cytidylyltransferase
MSIDGTVAVLLAAGSGVRFDASGARDKLLMPAGERCVLACSAAALLHAGLPVVAVVRADDAQREIVLRELGCHVVINQHATLGMGHSLSAAFAFISSRLPQAKAALIALADMPFISTATVSELAAALQRDVLVAPIYQGRRGHPVGVGRAYFDELSALSGDAGASHILKRDAAYLRLVPVEDAGVVRDIDTPADLVART